MCSVLSLHPRALQAKATATPELSRQLLSCKSNAQQATCCLCGRVWLQARVSVLAKPAKFATFPRRAARHTRSRRQAPKPRAPTRPISKTAPSPVPRAGCLGVARRAVAQGAPVARIAQDDGRPDRAPHKAVYAYQVQEPDELSLASETRSTSNSGRRTAAVRSYCDGRSTACGLFPGLYVEKVVDQAAAACLLQARVRGRLARAAPPPSQESDPTISLIREWERRAVQAEESLAEERRAAQAFREATSRSLEVLETTLAKSLAPLGGVVLEAPGVCVLLGGRRG